MASFLHDRTQMVKINGNTSLFIMTFILYINDISFKNDNKTDYVFAVDAATKTTGTHKTIDKKHQLTLNNVKHWLEQNKMTLSVKKQRECLLDIGKTLKTVFHYTRQN